MGGSALGLPVPWNGPDVSPLVPTAPWDGLVHGQPQVCGELGVPHTSHMGMGTCSFPPWVMVTPMKPPDPSPQGEAMEGGGMESVVRPNET